MFFLNKKTAIYNIVSAKKTMIRDFLVCIFLFAECLQSVVKLAKNFQGEEDSKWKKLNPKIFYFF